MSSYLRNHTYGAIGFLLVVAVGLAARNPRQQIAAPQFHSTVENGAGGLPAEQDRRQKKTDQIERPADFFVGQDRSAYQGHTIQRRLRKALLEYPDSDSSTKQWVDVAYVNVKKAGKVAGTFDANIYFGLGNSADFGFFPFLGGATKQLFISQDVPRGGRQWIVSLSPRFKVIFSGHELAVGREASDLGAIDLDNDGVYEVIAPITDFYAFQDKMSMSNIPLPDIIFKYRPTKEKYLPANSIFKNYLLEGLVEVPRPDRTLQNEFEHRSASLSNLLTYIYLGEEKQGWDFYDKHYELDDKEEIRRRVKEILRDQPVYNLTYNPGKRK
jgi:hypothetical protein